MRVNDFDDYIFDYFTVRDIVNAGLILNNLLAEGVIRKEDLCDLSFHSDEFYYDVLKLLFNVNGIDVGDSTFLPGDADMYGVNVTWLHLKGVFTYVEELLDDEKSKYYDRYINICNDFVDGRGNQYEVDISKDGFKILIESFVESSVCPYMFPIEEGHMFLLGFLKLGELMNEYVAMRRKPIEIHTQKTSISISTVTLAS